MRVILTGVSGFIGGHIARVLRNNKIETIGVSKKNSSAVSKYFEIPVIQGDVINLNELPKADVLIHCATANDNVSLSFKDGFQLSVLGTKNILDKAINAGVKKAVIFSTFQVYGKNPKGLISTRTEVSLESDYAINHYFAEVIGKSFEINNPDFKIIIARPSNVVGVPISPFTRRNYLVPHCFVREALENSKISLLSSGKQQRNFINVIDLAECVTQLIISNSVPKGIFNMCSNYNVSILEVAKIVADEVYRETGVYVGIDVNSNFPKKSNSIEIINEDNFSKTEFSKKKLRDIIQNLIQYELRI